MASVQEPWEQHWERTLKIMLLDNFYLGCVSGGKPNSDLYEDHNEVPQEEVRVSNIFSKASVVLLPITAHRFNYNQVSF